MRHNLPSRIVLRLASLLLFGLVLAACVTVIVPSAIPPTPTLHPAIITTIGASTPTETQAVAPTVTPLPATDTPVPTLAPTPAIPTRLPSATPIVVSKMPILGMLAQAWAYKAQGQYLAVTGFYRSWCDGDWCVKTGDALISLYIYCNSPDSNSLVDSGCEPASLKLIDGLGFTVVPSAHSIYPRYADCQFTDHSCSGWIGYEDGDTPGYWASLTLQWSLSGDIHLNLPDSSKL